MSAASRKLHQELEAFVKLCLHERLLAYLSPDTVTGNDGRHQNRCRGGCRLKWNMSQCLVRSDTVIYEAANQRPVDGLLLTFSSLSHFGRCLTPSVSSTGGMPTGMTCYLGQLGRLSLSATVV